MGPYDIRAYIALLLFVPLSLALIASSPKDRSIRTIFTIYMGGVMFLPELVAFDFPLVPPMSKQEFAGLMGLTAALVLERRRLFNAKPLTGVDLFFLVILLGNFGTVLTNGDVLSFGEARFRPDGTQWSSPVFLSNHKPYDIMSFGIRDTLSTYVPFLLGRAMFRTMKDAETMLKGIVILGLIYAPMCLLEARISPQIHTWVYGYPSTGFAGVARGDGFKPVVFQNSGLAVATFLFCAVACSAVLAKRGTRIWGLPAAVPMAVLWVVLALSHNVAALLYTLIALPIVLFSRGKLAVTASIGLAFFVLAYPMMRSSEMIDVYDLIEWIRGFSEDRAQSLETRFINEDQLLERAKERLTWGWGGYGRNRVYNEFGKDISITDGEWIIRVGARGVVGFIGVFGLLLAPIFVARRYAGKLPPEGRRYVDALAIICGMFAVDLLPNSLFTKLPFFIGGALAGLSRGIVDEKKGKPP